MYVRRLALILCSVLLAQIGGYRSGSQSLFAKHSSSGPEHLYFKFGLIFEREVCTVVDNHVALWVLYSTDP